MADAVVKPLLRGWLHLICFFLAVPVGIWLVVQAPSAAARAGSAVYALGLATLFGVSGLYHCVRWSPTWRRRMSRLDHSTIFLMIAGSYTPICLVVLRGPTAKVLLTAAWAGAITGAVLAWRSGRVASMVSHALYLALGWLVVLAGPQLAAAVERHHLVLLIAGGLLFTIGFVTLATHWPNPVPRVFGYHEVWHLLVVAAVVCHFIAIASVVRAAGPA